MSLIRKSGWKSADDFAREARHEWRRFWARPEQLAPPGKWRTWIALAGRGWGKTRTGAERIREQVERGARRVALVAPTAADARDVMVEGESGLLSVFPDDQRPTYEPSKRRVTWPNGAIATLFSADEPERLRGPQYDAAWCDELCAWRRDRDAWDMLQFGLRLGSDPRCIVTTTPKPTELLRELISRNGEDVVITGGSTYDNAANLAPGFLEAIRERYEGTTLGRQELHAEILGDIDGALWLRSTIDAHRVAKLPSSLSRVVVGVDPSVGKPGKARDIDEAGIVVVGIDANRHAYVLDDCSLRGTPDQWARQAIAAYHRHKADRLVAESNQGGEMVRLTLEAIDRAVPVTLVHASRGKAVRAEPVSALYEQGKVHHVGQFGKLEDEMCSWIPGGTSASPNRIDAMVHAVTQLALKTTGKVIFPSGTATASRWRS